MNEAKKAISLLNLSDEINPNCVTEHFKIGRYERPVIIVDNVFKDPSRIRELALSNEYTHQGINYPGLRSTTKLNYKTFFDLIKNYLPVSADRYTSGESEFCFYTHDQSKSAKLHMPHIDMAGNSLACVLYLNLPDQCSGGTAIYQHRPTSAYYFGEESFEEIWPEMQKRGQKDYRAYMRYLGFDDFEGCDANRNFELDLTSPDNPNPFIDYIKLRYEMLFKVEMRFNRMVMYESSLIHGPLFEKNFNSKFPSSARLTIRSFFYTNIGKEESRFIRLQKEAEEESAQFSKKNKPKTQKKSNKTPRKINSNSTEPSLSL